MDNSPKQRGFTLIELLVVIGIIGILATAAVVSTSESRASARFAKMKEDMRQIAVAAETYRNINRLYPCDVGPDEDPGSRDMTGARAAEVGTTCTNTQSLVGDGYLSSFPQPPCRGWTYDYENWVQIGGLPTGSADSQVVRVSIRKNTGTRPEPVPFYYCLLDTHGSTEYTCGGRTGDGLATLGGEDITHSTGGKLYCN